LYRSDRSPRKAGIYVIERQVDQHPRVGDTPTFARDRLFGFELRPQTVRANPADAGRIGLKNDGIRETVPLTTFVQYGCANGDRRSRRSACA